MFESLRLTLFIRRLRQFLLTQQRRRAAHTLQTAATIGVLFDATDDQARREALEWAQKLKSSGKKVNTLGFFDTPKPPVPAPDFDFYFAKETTFDHRPKSAKAEAFAREKWDMLLCINLAQRPTLEWLAAQSAAAMKIGMATEYPNDYDLQLDLPAAKGGVRAFSEQLPRYLDTIIPAKVKL